MALAGDNGKSRQKRQRQGYDDVTSNAPKTLQQESKSKSPIDIPLELQQFVLNVFESTFSDKFDESLAKTIQDIKQHLFHRDFASAFSKQAFLDAYVMRWSPSRALAYFDVFDSVQEIHRLLRNHTRYIGSSGPNRTYGYTTAETSASYDKQSLPDSQGRTTKMKVLNLGGGAGAELVALAALQYRVDLLATQDGPAPNGLLRPKMNIDMIVLDIADWSAIISQLDASLDDTAVMPPSPLNPNAREKIQTIYHPPFHVNFIRQDLLEMGKAGMGPLFRNTALVTLMFTLNELYNHSMSATTQFLLLVTEFVPPGALLLVVDSPGSYSTVNLGKDKESRSTRTPKNPSDQKKYPMVWLLEHTLLEVASVGSSRPSEKEKQWEKLKGDESKWFRLPQGLRYPIGLENMRYQMHLYRRL